VEQVNDNSHFAGGLRYFDAELHTSSLLLPYERCYALKVWAKNIGESQ
jgi:hypothetical protein